MTDSGSNQVTENQRGVSGSWLIIGGGVLVAIFILWFVIQRFESPIDPPALWDQQAVDALETIQVNVCACTDATCLESTKANHRALKEQYGGAPESLRDRLRLAHTAIEACRKRLSDELRSKNGR